MLLFFPMLAKAEMKAWEIVTNESNLTFTATQNNSPVTGKFNKFTGKINFDLSQLSASNVIIKVDTGSVFASYSDLVDALKASDWFNVKVFPEAIFEAQDFKKIGNMTYKAKGKLTIRNKTQPVVIKFIVEEATDTKARVKGSTTLKRSAFSVGQGEWASTVEIKDEVKVDFVLTVRVLR
jgi:polyisoprenoid-binding protein YceI